MPRNRTGHNDADRGVSRTRADRFSLRRGNRRIGSPEWWQLRELFVGIAVRGEEEEESRPEPEDSVLRALRRLIPDGPRNGESGGALWYEAYYVTDAIDGTPIREGDFLLYACGAPSGRPPPSFGGGRPAWAPLHLHCK